MSEETLMTDGEQTQLTEGDATEDTTDTNQPSEGEQAEDKDKPEGESNSEGEQTEDKPEGAPEAYDFKQTEGKELDSAVIDAYSEAAKELNLTQDNAQKMLDTMSTTMAQRQAEQMQTVRDGWESDAKSDKEFGGESLNENLSIAKKAMDQFGTPELTSLLNETGLGNHPEIIRAFYRAGKNISEDSFVGGGNNPDKGNATAAQRMYPGMNP